MKLAILIDEDLHRSISEVFQELGFKVFDVRDVGLRGKADDEVFDWAQRKNAIIVSGDLDFANILKFPKHRGMIILRFPNKMLIEVINEEVKRLLKDLKSEDYKNNLIIVSPDNLRIRHPAPR